MFLPVFISLTHNLIVEGTLPRTRTGKIEMSAGNRVRQHVRCCCVWVNGLSWRSTKGVDIAVQINNSSVVQVVGRSKAGSERLHRYTSTVVQDIAKTIAQLSSKLEATPYIVHPYTPTLWKDPKAIQTDSLYPVSSITRCISNGDDHVLSLPKKDGDHPQQMSLSEVFGWLPSLPVVQEMDFADPSSSSAGEWNATSVYLFSYHLHLTIRSS